jgi:hypothetical protein
MALTATHHNQASILSYTNWFNLPHSQPLHFILIALPLSHSIAPFAPLNTNTHCSTTMAVANDLCDISYQTNLHHAYI